MTNPKLSMGLISSFSHFGWSFLEKLNRITAPPPQVQECGGFEG